jgi:predicted secreted protein
MAETTLTMKDSGGTVVASPNERIRVRLPENAASTGYRWAPANLGARILRLESSELLLQATAAIGASRTRELVFVVCSSGRETLRLVCKRPWDPDEAGETFVTNVEVSSA